MLPGSINRITGPDTEFFYGKLYYLSLRKVLPAYSLDFFGLCCKALPIAPAHKLPGRHYEPCQGYKLRLVGTPTAADAVAGVPTGHFLGVKNIRPLVPGDYASQLYIRFSTVAIPILFIFHLTFSFLTGDVTNNLSLIKKLKDYICQRPPIPGNVISPKNK